MAMIFNHGMFYTKYIYSTNFKYSIILNLIYSKNNKVRRHALRHPVSLSYMPLTSLLDSATDFLES